MTHPKLTCAPDPPPFCAVINGTEVCLAPPIRCVETCTAPGVCTVTCCAAFAPAPVPVGGPVMVGLMVATIALAAWCWMRKRLPTTQ